MSGDAPNSGPNHGDSVSYTGDNNLHDQLSRQITSQSKQLLDLVDVVEQLKREKDTEKDGQNRQKDEEIKDLKQQSQRKDEKMQELTDQIQMKDEEINRLKDDLQYIQGEMEKMKSQGAQLNKRTPIFLGMESNDTLHTFIDKKIRPDDRFNRECNKIIDNLVRLVQQEWARECPQNSIKRIVKSGSLGKGTHVRGMSDIDLIIFFNGYKNVQELQSAKKEVLEKLKDCIKKNWQGNLWFKDLTSFSLQFYLDIEGLMFEVDLLPAIDITQSGRPLSDIYTEMKSLKGGDRGAYSSCLAPLQVKFVTKTKRVSTPGKVKDLIRLLKYWTKTEEVPVKSYCLELLVVGLWREQGKPTNIEMYKCLRMILQQLVDVKTMNISFEDNYEDYKVYAPQQKKSFLLDPANPFRNVAPSPSEADVVVRKATALLERM